MTQCPGRGGDGDMESTNLEKTRWSSDPSLGGATEADLYARLMLSWAYATAHQAPFRFYAFFLPLLMCMVHSTRPLVCCRSSKVALNGGGDGSPFSFPILSDHPPKALGQVQHPSQNIRCLSLVFYLVALNYYSTLPVELLSFLNSSSRFFPTPYSSLLHRPWSCHSGYLVLFET